MYQAPDETRTFFVSPCAHLCAFQGSMHHIRFRFCCSVGSSQFGQILEQVLHIWLWQGTLSWPAFQEVRDSCRASVSRRGRRGILHRWVFPPTWFAPTRIHCRYILSWQHQQQRGKESNSARRNWHFCFQPQAL